MPLIKSASKQAFKKNVETEMRAHPGKENRARNLAIAYSVQRRNKKKMADGGPVPQPSPEPETTNTGQALKSIREAFGGDHKAHGGMIAYSPKPKMKGRHLEQSHEYYDDSRDPAAYAEGGHIEESRKPHMEHRHLEQEHEQLEERDPAAYSRGGRIHMSRKPHMEDRHLEQEHEMIDEREPSAYSMGGYAEGGMPDSDEVEEHNEDSIADAILAKKHMAHGGMPHSDDVEEHNEHSLADTILAKKHKRMAHGGAVDNEEHPAREIYRSRDQEMANADLYDDDQLDEQPEDSNEHGDEHERSEENEHAMNMIDILRRKIKAKRGL